MKKEKQIGGQFYSEHYLDSGSAVHQAGAGKKYSPPTEPKA